MNVDLNYLHTFLTVWKEGGFLRASRRLYLTQPAVSYQVKMLEHQLGVRLFDRSGRKALPTPQGKVLAGFCERFFAEFESVRTRITGKDVAAGEMLSIASVSVFGRYVLFPTLGLPEFRDLRIHLLFPEAIEVLGLVETGRCELGFVFEKRVSSRLEFQPVYNSEYILIGKRSLFPDLRRLHTYEKLPMVTYDEYEYVFGKWFQANFSRQPERINSVQHYEELEEVIESVRLGRGFSIVPAEIIRGRGLYRIRPFKTKGCFNTIYSVMRPNAFVRPEVERLLQTL